MRNIKYYLLPIILVELHVNTYSCGQRFFGEDGPEHPPRTAQAVNRQEAQQADEFRQQFPHEQANNRIDQNNPAAQNNARRRVIIAAEVVKRIATKYDK